MSKNVLVLGFDGYIGHALTLRLLYEGYNVYGIDDGSRRDNVTKVMDSFSALPINTLNDRVKKFRKIGTFDSEIMDICSEEYIPSLRKIFETFQPDVVVNLAQQPSAPFSHLDNYQMRSTTYNNIMGTLNIIQCIKEFCLDAHLIQIGSMGEYQVDVDTDIAEGLFEFDYNGRKSKTSIFPRRPGSIYHSSKVASTYLIDCACRFWGMRAIDIMQGVVYGNWTPEIEETGMDTRLDSDESFGTVINRFIVQAIISHPLTIYGEGLHKRGFLAINDSVQCLMLAVENKPSKGEYITWNQLDEVFSMNEIANKIQKVGKEHGFDVGKKYIPTPRKEVVSDHYYNPITSKLVELGFKQTRFIEDEADYVFSRVGKNTNLIDRISRLQKVSIPKIKW